MRIYYQIGETKYTSDELGQAMQKSVASVHIMAMELLRYKIMWSLRSLETEINHSGGIITIYSDTLGAKTKISVMGFPDALLQKINAIAGATRF